MEFTKEQVPVEPALPGVPEGRRPCLQQVQRVPSRSQLRSWAYIDIPYTA